MSTTHNYTPRGFTKAIKNVLAELGIAATVKSQTLNFSGLGYGQGCTADVQLEHALTDEAKTKLAVVEAEFRASGQGPEFSEKQKSAFSISLRGTPYPFGGKVH